VEFIVQAYQKADTLEAEQAATQARQNPIETLVGELAFNAQGNLEDSAMHFFQVQGKSFQEAFARQVGAEPQTTQDSSAQKSTLLEKDFASDKEPIIFADLNWNSALFGNSLARFIIESGYDYPTYATPGSSVPLFQSLRKGDLHIYMEVWLPNTQELYDQAVSNQQVVDVGLYFGDAVQGWFVPRYVVEGDSKRDIKAVAPDLKSIDDLKRYAHLFASQTRPGIGRLMDGSPGWFSYKIDCMKLKAYRLDDKYAQVTLGSGTALFNELDEAYEQGKPILVYLFGPSWPLAKFDLIQLEEPEFTQDCWSTNKGCEFPLNQVKIVIHKNLPQRAIEVVEFLGKLQLTSEEISQVLLQMREKDLKPEEAAIAWLKENETTWAQWVSAEAAQKVKQALKQ
jgi:glycine betaine/proline transport system substrate-binding protein